MIIYYNTLPALGFLLCAIGFLVYFLYIVSQLPNIQKRHYLYIFIVFLLLASFIALAAIRLSFHNHPAFTIDNGLIIGEISHKITYDNIKDLTIARLPSSKGRKRENAIRLTLKDTSNLYDTQQLSFLQKFYIPKYYQLRKNSLIIFNQDLGVSPEYLINLIRSDYSKNQQNNAAFLPSSE